MVLTLFDKIAGIAILGLLLYLGNQYIGDPLHLFSPQPVADKDDFKTGSFECDKNITKIVQDINGQAFPVETGWATSHDSNADGNFTILKKCVHVVWGKNV